MDDSYWKIRRKCSNEKAMGRRQNESEHRSKNFKRIEGNNTNKFLKGGGRRNERKGVM